MEDGLRMFLIPEVYRNSSARALYDAHQRRGWTYRELCDAVQQTATLLASRNKALLFLFCRNDASSVIAYLAAIEAGHAVALVDENLAPEFKKRLMELYQPEFILSPVATATVGIEEIQGTYSQASIGDPPLYVWSSDAQRPDSIYPDLALLLGAFPSTGSPKLVRLTPGNVESSALATCAGLQIGTSDKAITSLPMHDCYGLSVINSHLRAGAGLVLTTSGLTTSDFWNVFREQDCTSWAGIPASFGLLRRLDLEKLEVSSLRTLIQAGGTLPTDVAVHLHQWMAQRGGRFYGMYGQTEAAGRMCILPAEMLPEKLGSCGRAMEGGALAVEAEAGLSKEPGVIGEVVYRGPNVMLGYAATREDLSRGDELHGTLRTGDLGYLDADGYLFLTGRRKQDRDAVLTRVAP